MKKLITLGLLAIAAGASAQKGAIIAHPANAPKTRHAAHRGTATVSGYIQPLSFTDQGTCGYAIYGDQDGGYVTGVNSYGDKAKMMRYTLSDFNLDLPAHVDTAFVYFATKHVGNNGNVTVKVYSATAAGEPGTLLGTSNPKSVSSIDTADLTTFTFPSQVNLTTNKYFLSVDISGLYATQDTVGILSTEEDCSDTDTASAWEQFADGTFIKMADSWPVVLDMGIFSYVTANDRVGISNVVKNNFGATAYPVPANNTVTISFVGQDNADATLNLKDITGKTIASSTLKTIKGSSYKVPFDVTSLSSGMYFVELASGNNKGMIKVSVQ